MILKEKRKEVADQASRLRIIWEGEDDREKNSAQDLVKKRTQRGNENISNEAFITRLPSGKI